MRLLKLFIATLAPIFSFLKPSDASAILILNMINEETLPRNFRTSQSCLPSSKGKMPSLEGLRELNISGSAQFSALSWRAIKEATHYKGSFFDVDLREETHGFLNGSAISLYSPRDWGNRGKTDEEIRKEEDAWIRELSKEKIVDVKIVEKKIEGFINETSTIKVEVKKVLSEQDLIHENSSGYLRLYVSDHSAPTPEDVDLFIRFIKKIPIESWIHFHCAAGNGRTTTFMAIYDMMCNAKKVSLDDIVLRQHLLGGVNLFRQYDPLYWKFPYAKEKENFIRNFYEYARTNHDGFNTKWSKFLREKIKNGLGKRN